MKVDTLSKPDAYTILKRQRYQVMHYYWNGLLSQTEYNRKMDAIDRRIISISLALREK